ncbi:unnamed protein product, partial [Effrenium voratum]
EPARGADVLRFWVASVDFSNEVSISWGLRKATEVTGRGQNILKNAEENVRRLRNRARFACPACRLCTSFST